MAQIQTQTLKERKELEQKREREIMLALSGRKRVLAKSKRDKQQKRKSAGELLSLVRIANIQGKALRPAWTHVPRGYNLDRQLVGLLNHLFVRYPVPAFLYRACLPNDDRFSCMDETYREWFVTLAQGGSFSKSVKGLMTSKEAFAFLAAPTGNRIHENVWWAKMKVAGLPESTIRKLNERIFSQYFFDDPDGRMAELVQFYARYYRDMNKVTFGEVTDFLAWKLQNDPAFRLKGRTASSVIKLTNEWHVLMQKAKLGQTVEWKGLDIPDWEFEAGDKIWTVTELRNNKELMNEGRKQKHCVYSYVRWCIEGRSAIFSLRGYRKVPSYMSDGQMIWCKKFELTRVTIEVSSAGDIVQVRGNLNRKSDDDEKKILRQWAGEKGLITRT